MTAPVSQVLSEAADLLEKPGAWTQGEFARAADGTPLCAGWEPEATCFCAVGAIERVIGMRGDYWPARFALADGLPMEAGVVGFNDAEGRTQEEVVAAFRRAAALAKEQGR